MILAMLDRVIRGPFVFLVIYYPVVIIQTFCSKQDRVRSGQTGAAPRMKYLAPYGVSYLTYLYTAEHEEPVFNTFFVMSYM